MLNDTSKVASDEQLAGLDQAERKNVQKDLVTLGQASLQHVSQLPEFMTMTMTTHIEDVSNNYQASASVGMSDGVVTPIKTKDIC